MQLYLARNNGIIPRPQGDRARRTISNPTPSLPRELQVRKKTCIAAASRGNARFVGFTTLRTRLQHLLLTRAWPRLPSPLALSSRGHSLPAQPELEYTAGPIEGKWPRTIKAECCKPNTKLPACGVVHFGTQPCVVARYPMGYRAVAAPCADGFVTQPENRQTPRRSHRPVMRLSGGNSSRARKYQQNAMV